MISSIITLATIITVVVFLSPLILSIGDAIFLKNNYFHRIKERYNGMFEAVSHPFVIVAIVLIILNCIVDIIVRSGVNVQIGSIFEANSFLAKYRATVEVENLGDIGEQYIGLSLSDMDGETLDVVIEKFVYETEPSYSRTFWGDEVESSGYDTKYHIRSIEYKNYILVNAPDSEEAEVNEAVEFVPEEIYRNYELFTEYEDPPTYKVTLSDVLVENLTKNNNSIGYLFIITFIAFICLCAIFLIWFVFKKTKSKKALVITSIIALIISSVIVLIPFSYIYLHSNTDASSQTFLVNSDSKKIHLEDCRSIDSKNNCVEITDYDKAIENGCKPCKVCNPDLPAENRNSTPVNSSSSNYTYLLNPDTNIIHRYNCYTIKHKENFLRSNDYDEAIEKGYRPCEVCDPE